MAIKITALPAASASADTQLLEVVTDPSGSPVSEKLSLNQLRTVNIGAIGTTVTTGERFVNSAAATNGNQQISPALLLQGEGWAATPAASMTTGYRLYTEPVQDPNIPATSQPRLAIENLINGSWERTAAFVKDGLWIGTGAGTGGLNIFNSGLDVCYGGSPGGIIIGADNNLTTRTNNTNKFARIGLAPYSTSQRFNAVLVASSTSSTTNLQWGGGTSILHAVTAHNFYTGANITTTTGTVRLTIDSGGAVTVAGDTFIVATAKTPANAGDTGVTGHIAWDSDFIYVCTATNTWKRVAIATWP